MIVTARDIINVGEVSANGYLRLDAMFNMFQEMAVLHTHQVGFELKDLLNEGKTWVLNRVLVRISQLPRLEEGVIKNTWSRKIHRFKGLRDYEICLKQKPIITASSMWVYVDGKKARPVRVPGDLEKRYGSVSRQAVDVDLENLRYKSVTNPDQSISIATRVSDYDINGHVNNAVILQYLETALFRLLKKEDCLREIQILFLKEIPRQVAEVTIHLEKTTAGCLFEIEHRSSVFVRGAVSFHTTTTRGPEDEQAGRI